MSLISDNMIENLLLTCGATEKESRIFLDLVEHGESIASLIAKRTKIKRPTAYLALQELLRLGIVSSRSIKGVTYFKSLSPEMVSRVITNKAEKEYDSTKTAAKLLKSHLDGIKHPERDFGAFDITTMDSMETTYAQLEEAIMSGDFCAVFNPQVALQTPRIRDLVVGFLESTSKTKPKIREIFPAGSDTDFYTQLINNPNHEFKTIEKDRLIVSDVIIFDGAVVLNNYEHDLESSIKIKEPGLYKTMQTVFDMLWEQIP